MTLMTPLLYKRDNEALQQQFGNVKVSSYNLPWFSLQVIHFKVIFFKHLACG